MLVPEVVCQSPDDTVESVPRVYGGYGYQVQFSGSGSALFEGNEVKIDSIGYLYRRAAEDGFVV